MFKTKSIDTVMKTSTKAAADLEAIAEAKAFKALFERLQAQDLEAEADRKRGVASALRTEGAKARGMAARITGNFGLE